MQGFQEVYCTFIRGETVQRRRLVMSPERGPSSLGHVVSSGCNAAGLGSALSGDHALTGAVCGVIDVTSSECHIRP